MPMSEYQEDVTAQRAASETLRFHFSTLSKVRGGYARDETTQALNLAIETVQAMESHIAHLEALDRDNAHRIATASREIHDLRIRLADAEGSVGVDDLRMQRAGRMAQAQVHVERVMEAAQGRANGVVHAARRRADEIIAEAERRAQVMLAGGPGDLPHPPEETGVVTIDAKNEAIWLGSLRDFIATRTVKLRDRIRSEIEGLKEAEAALGDEVELEKL